MSKLSGSVAAIVVGFACAGNAPASEAANNAAAAAGLGALPTARDADTCQGRQDAFLSARLRGAVSTDILWRAPGLSCAGGVRPDGRGIRVTFSGRDHAHRVLFIFGIDAPPRPGLAHDIATNLTVIFEGEQRIYSTAGSNRCTIDELRLRSLPAPAGPAPLGVRARGFCIAPADALGTGAALLVSKFDFSAALLPETATNNGRPAAAQRDAKNPP
jgi:hypothetical protein